MLSFRSGGAAGMSDTTLKQNLMGYGADAGQFASAFFTGKIQQQISSFLPVMVFYLQKMTKSDKFFKNT